MVLPFDDDVATVCLSASAKRKLSKYFDPSTVILLSMRDKLSGSSNVYTFSFLDGFKPASHNMVYLASLLASEGSLPSLRNELLSS